jgi:hypothetical protein
VAEKIKVGKNAKIILTEMDEDQNIKDRVRAEIAKANRIIVNQPANEWMDWNTKSPMEVILKNN